MDPPDVAYIDFLSAVHGSTKRDYLARVNEHPKADAARRAGRWGLDYWDGDRKFGYGGYRYDGRWRKVADQMVAHYGLKPGQRVLDVGSGKAFLVHDMSESVPGIQVFGIDVSHYGLVHSKEEARPRLAEADAALLPFPDSSFDFVYSINTLHNLPCHRLDLALREMERVGRGPKYLCVESFRNEEEKVNLLYWQLTCRSFYAPDEWEWWFRHTGYTGDHSFIYFE